LLQCKNIKSCTARLPPFPPPEQMQKDRPLVEDGPCRHENALLVSSASVS